MWILLGTHQEDHAERWRRGQGGGPRPRHHLPRARALLRDAAAARQEGDSAEGSAHPHTQSLVSGPTQFIVAGAVTTSFAENFVFSQKNASISWKTSYPTFLSCKGTWTARDWRWPRPRPQSCEQWAVRGWGGAAARPAHGPWCRARARGVAGLPRRWELRPPLGPRAGWRGSWMTSTPTAGTWRSWARTRRARSSSSACPATRPSTGLVWTGPSSRGCTTTNNSLVRSPPQGLKVATTRARGPAAPPQPRPPPPVSSSPSQSPSSRARAGTRPPRTSGPTPCRRPPRSTRPPTRGPCSGPPASHPSRPSRAGTPPHHRHHQMHLLTLPPMDIHSNCNHQKQTGTSLCHHYQQRLCRILFSQPKFILQTISWLLNSVNRHLWHLNKIWMKTTIVNWRNQNRTFSIKTLHQNREEGNNLAITLNSVLRVILDW